MNRILKSSSRAIFLLLGLLSAGLGVEGFLQPSGFIDGGITGISMLLSTTLEVPLFVLIPLINLPFLFLGYNRIGRNFALKSAIAILGLSLALALIEFPAVTTDKLLSAVFGGIFLGAGIGLSIRGGGVLDGTEVLAVVSSERTGLTVGDVILMLNAVIFTVAAFLLGIEPALYSVLTYFSASKTVDFLLNGIEEYYGLMIVSTIPDDLRRAVVEDLGRAVTRLRGKGGLNEVEQDVLYCVATRLEVPGIRATIHSVDPNAFVVVGQLSDVRGGVIKQRPLQRLGS